MSNFEAARKTDEQTRANWAADVKALRAEVDRLKAELAAAREKHQTEKDLHQNALAELAAERERSAEQAALALKRTVERDLFEERAERLEKALQAMYDEWMYQAHEHPNGAPLLCLHSARAENLAREALRGSSNG